MQLFKYLRRVPYCQVAANDNKRCIKKTLPALICEITLIVIFLMSLEFAYGQSDFYLEVNVSSNADPRYPLEITKLEFHGQGDKVICPSGQCKIGLTRNYFFGYRIPLDMDISYNFEFHPKDEINNANVGPKKKEFLEKFSADFLL